MALTLITPAAGIPVSRVDLAVNLRADETIEEDVLDACIGRAQAYLAERSGWTGVACLTSTWDVKLDAFPCGATLRAQAIRLPLRPVQSVTSVKYLDTAGVEQTLDPSGYTVHVDEDPSPALIAPVYGTTWPSTRWAINAVRVRFVAGWTDPSAISANVRNALVLLASHFYTHRDDNAEVPDGLLGQLLANERMYA